MRGDQECLIHPAATSDEMMALHNAAGSDFERVIGEAELEAKKGSPKR